MSYEAFMIKSYEKQFCINWQDIMIEPLADLKIDDSNFKLGRSFLIEKGRRTYIIEKKEINYRYEEINDDQIINE